MKKLLLFLCIIFASLALIGCGAENIEIDDYVVVIPQDADTTTKYAAENFVLLVEEKTGAILPIVSDSEAEVENEILIGETSREQSKTKSTLADKQYLLFENDGKIVMKGYGIYVGASCGDFINKYAIIDTSSGKFDIKNVPDEETILNYEPHEMPKSIIFMIGDGMGANHVSMAEKNGLDGFVAKSFPYIGTSITRSQSVINGDAEYTDSAAGATAMSTGYKTINDYIGLDKDANSVQNIRELAFSVGAKTAVITTDVITGATPSSYMCHNISRTNTEELQAQIDALVAENKIDYLAGDVAENLTLETKNALEKISSDSSSFFIMIEEGIIDKRSHDKDEEGAIECVKRFDDAIEYATQFALCHPDTALIVTADHETGKLVELNGAPHGYVFLSYAHTNIDVPIYAIGAGTSRFDGAKIENIELAKFCASAYTKESFGQSWSEE